MGLLKAWLEGERFLLGDGAMGTMLQAAGLAPGEAPERLNAEDPQVVHPVHEGYLSAGAEVLTTNTFGGNRIRLALHGLGDRLFELNRAGAAIARRAADACGREVLVAGSVGPTGSLLEPIGDLPFGEAKAAFAGQCRALAEGGVDFILLETFSDLEEARAAAEGARSACDLPLFCTMTFDAHGRTMMGTSPEEAAAALGRLGVQALGSNCGNGPAEMERTLARMREARPSVPLIVQSNAGIPRVVGGEIAYEVGPEEMAAHAVRCLDLGARYIGGCCGTTPEHIRAMGEALRRLRGRNREGGHCGGGE
ncbi:MAG: homocysteine S-methyltransferase family protein [Nitrospinota bacterium]